MKMGVFIQISECVSKQLVMFHLAAGSSATLYNLLRLYSLHLQQQSLILDMAQGIL